MVRRKPLESIEIVESEAVSEIESLIKELKGEGFNIFRRSLPFGVNKVVALNVPTFKDALLLVKSMKLKTIEKDTDDGKQIIFYDILPNTVSLDDLLYNQSEMTTVGNKKKTVAEAYFDLGSEE